MNIIPIKRALLSVSNKEGVVEFAQKLATCGVEIISTGGTSKLLKEAGIAHLQVDDITGLPEMLDGRVKTLHPKIHGGILGKRGKHDEEANKHDIKWIDLVVVNFYPFDQVAKGKNLGWDEVVSLIDIGGPTMVRAAAKNFAWVAPVVDPTDYQAINVAISQQGGLDFAARQQLAEKAFAYTYRYDAMIHGYFQQGASEASFPPAIDVRLEKWMELRYGENPHQKASVYQLNKTPGILTAVTKQGKPLSYNNIVDAEAAWTCVSEFAAPACVIIKHANPCGVATASDINVAYAKAYQSDSLSAFGGIVALNRPCTTEIAKALNEIFIEVVLAPAFTAEALALFATKPNVRVLEIAVQNKNQECEMKFITGGVLVQERDPQVITADDLKVVTQTKPSQDDIENMLFAWQVVKHIKSNAILLAKDFATVGIGAGQVSRIDAVDLAVRKAGDRMTNAVLASDAFFPFRDSIDSISKTGVRAIIQPGGSVRDAEVVDACNEHGIAMVFTGKRCFRH